jgi:pimeloyl-ACP methyl ester carboxylesterase
MTKLFAALVAGLLVAGSAAGASAATGGRADGPDGRRSYTGTIDGAEYRVETPERWNGTLVLYSHGYGPPGFDFPPQPVSVSNAPETEEWLLDHGYALAASEYQNDGIGYRIEDAIGDQLALLDWYDANVGRPERTVVVGQSLGVTVSTLLAERYPGRFDGVLNLCGAYDPLNTFNHALDVNFTVKTLLAAGQDIDLLGASDPIASRDALAAVVDRERATPQGRARLALAAAFGNVTGWYFSLQPKPAELTGWIQQQIEWVKWAKIYGNGPVAFADLEQVAGGNPLWNVGVDYARQLARSSQRDVVLRAYRDAGLDLRADLARLAAAPRIAPEPDAVRYMFRYGVVRGSTPRPVLAMHTTGDGGAPHDQERWYAEQVRRGGDPSRLRQLYVERGGHCSFSTAEEVTALRALLEKMATGRWPDVSPGRLNAAANGFDPHYHRVPDLSTGTTGVLPPAFTRFRPPSPLRPSR